MLGIVVGTGPSLVESADAVRRLQKQGALVFGCNNTFNDFHLDVWLACDPAWHGHYGQIDLPNTDQWHWNASICHSFGYRHVEGIWMDGLWMADPSKISLGHCSGHQLLNLACNQYACDTVALVGHDFRYEPGKPRHYFTGLSDMPSEYPGPLRKHSLFKKPDGNDLLAVYKHIADQDGLPEIINATPGSALPWFPFRSLDDFIEH